jgi:hypothetical protein
MKLDQLAFYCSTTIAAEELMADLGLSEATWTYDTVTGNSKVTQGYSITGGVNVAELSFNYDLGIELEIIRYIDGPHWHPPAMMAGHRFFSHVGAHLDDGEPFPSMPHSRLVQETFTVSHTNAYLTDPNSTAFGRKYHYRIHEIGPNTYIKFIRRIHPHSEPQ